MPPARTIPRLALAAAAAALVPLLLARPPAAPPPVVERAAPAPRPGEAAAAPAPSSSASPRPLGSGPVRPGSASMQHLDPRRTNRSPFVAPRSPRVVWSFNMGSAVAAPPAVAAGLLVAASLSGKVSGLGFDGRERWTVDLQERVYSGPLAQGEAVVLGVDKGKVLSLDARTGKTQWQLDVDGDADTAPAPTPDGGLALAAGRYAYKISKNGTVRWRHKHRKKLFASPAVGDDGTIYFSGQDGALLAFAPDGALRWKASLGADADAGLAVADDGVVLAGTDGGEVVAVEPAKGAVRWRSQLGGFVRGPLSVARDGAVLASSYGPAPAVFALDGKSGDPLWRFGVRGTGAREFGIHGAPIEDAEGTLIFGAQDDVLYALSPEGAPRWRLQLGGDIDGAVVLDERLLFVGCGDGNVYALGDGG